MPTTSIDALTGGIRVNWAVPYSNSEVIDQYLVEARQSDGTWTTVCSGSNFAVV